MNLQKAYFTETIFALRFINTHFLHQGSKGDLGNSKQKLKINSRRIYSSKIKRAFKNVVTITSKRRKQFYQFCHVLMLNDNSVIQRWASCGPPEHFVWPANS